MENLRQRLIQWTNSASVYIARFYDRVAKWAHKGLMYLEKFWAWFQSINFPNIPLSSIQWVLLFYTVFVILYGLATPVFEAGDELRHFGYVRHIIETGDLPVQDIEAASDTLYLQHGSQPPLYYLTAAVIASPFDLSDFDSYLMFNPYVRVDLPGFDGNKNLLLRDNWQPVFSGTSLAVYVLRLFGAALGAGTIWLVYRIGQIAAPQRPVAGIVAAAITAFNPMFLFMSASVNNTPLAILLNTAVIYLALLTMRESFDWRRSVLIGLLLGLSLLTKFTSWALVPPLVVLVIWLALRDRNWRGLAIQAASFVGFMLLIAGWWYVRNMQLYDDITGTSIMAQIAGLRPENFTFASVINEFQLFRMSYWGLFGLDNIQTGTLFYALVDFAVFISFGGIAFLVAQLVSIRRYSYIRLELTGLLFLLGITLTGMIGYFWWTMQTRAPEGYILFPIMGAINPLIAIGIVEMGWWLIFIMSPPDRSFVRATDAVDASALRRSFGWAMGLFGILALLVPLSTIAPEYQPPPKVTALPDGVSRVYADYGPVELVGYSRTDRRYTPGERVPVEFYWRVTEQTDEDLTLSLAFIDPNGEAIGFLDTYPGAGTLRTSTWEAGAIYRDAYSVGLLPLRIDGRFPFRVYVNWKGADEALSGIVDQNGDAMRAVMLDVGAVVAALPEEDTTSFIEISAIMPEAAAPGEFADTYRLTAFDFDLAAVTLYLDWQTIFAPAENHTVFAHIYDEDGRLVAQHDVFPDLPTRYWRSSENYITTHKFPLLNAAGELMLEPGTYEVRVGWYSNDGDELPRLPLKVDNPENPDEVVDAFSLLTFEVDTAGRILTPDIPELMIEETPEVEDTDEPINEPIDTPVDEE